VYLDHHWVLDAIAGVAYCLVVVGVARALTRWRASRPEQGSAVLGKSAP
jgi:hypothetical protein